MVGRISTSTFSGISSAAVGLEGDLDHRLLAVLGDLADLADEHAVDPDVAELRELEAGPVGLDGDHRDVVEDLLVDRDRERDQQGDDARNATPATNSRLCSRGLSWWMLTSIGHPRYPVIRTVVVEPQMAKLRKKSATTIVTMLVRIARPTAMPTPAGPPDAV